MEGLNWQSLQLPLAAGLNQKVDERALQPPELLRAVDVEFDELGGLQTRKPFGDVGVNIFGGGTLSNIRRIVENDNELLCFTKDTLYSWNAQVSAWVSKGTHLAVKVEEEPVFIATGEQADCDRAELSGTIVYTWTQAIGSTSQGYVAAVDKTTGSVLMAPTALAGSAARLRVTALSTKILLTFYDGINGLYAYALDPAAPATALAGASTTVTNVNYGTYYDIVKVPSADQAAFVARQNPTTSYTVGTITAGLVVAKSTKARTCTGPIAVSAAPNGTQVQVIYSNVTDIKGDLITLSTLADVYTAQAVGTASTTPNQIACAHRSVQNSSQYRCYAFWSAGENSDPTDWTSKYNWVDTGNTLGTQANFVRYLGIGSRAFDYDGTVYVWGTFAQSSGEGYNSLTAQLQNTYFLYRDSGTLANAKAASTRAGGFCVSQGHLPNVALTGTGEYSWCGVERRIVPVGTNGDKAYADRGPRDIIITFDSNEARRCVRLGATLYITGGELVQYDGQQLTEVGFHVYPWSIDPAATGGGTLYAGTYAYRATWRWQNAAGDTDRSTSATTATQVVSDGQKVLVGSFPGLFTTHKSNVAVEVWRTPKNPTDDAPLYLVTSQDPTATTNPNRYLSNDPTAAATDSLEDDIVDDDLLSLPTSPENGAVLENICPPGATLIASTATRLFLAGIAGDPDRVWYSKQRNAGEVAAFHEALAVDVPQAGGDITALAITKDGTPVVFRETATYVLLGDGFDNASNGQNYVAREASSDFGAVNAESVAVTDGGVIFKSSRGWCRLNQAFQVEFIGGNVTDYDSETPLAVQVVESQHQVRILTASRMLVLDTLAQLWAEWTVASGVSACMWGGRHVYATATAVKRQALDFTGIDYGMDVETAWIKLADLQGFGRIRKIEILGEYRSSHTLRIRLARDYQTTYFQDKTWTPSPTTVGGPEQVKHSPSIQQVQAIKVRITASAGESLKLTGLGLEVGVKRGLYNRMAAAQRQ